MRNGVLDRHRRGVAAIAILIAAAAVYMAFTKRLPFLHGYRVEAVFTSIAGVKKGSPIRAAGVEVGTVLERRAGPGKAGTLVIELSDQGRPVHTDATMRIRPRTFLEGGYYVELKSGSPSAPELRDGGTVPLPQTTTSVQFGQILSTLDSDIRGDLVGVIHELSVAFGDGGAQALGRGMRPLGPTLRDASVVADAARGSAPHDVTDLIGGASRIAAAIAARDDELARLVTDLNTTTGVLADRDDQLAATVRGLDATLAEAPAALRAVDTALPPARRFVGGLRPSLRRLPPILDDGNAVLLQLEGIVRPAELPLLLSRLRPAVTRLPGLTRDLQPLLRLVTPVTDCVRDRALPVLTAQLTDGALSTGQPAYLELLHATVGAASATMNFDGNGYGGRVQGGFGEQTYSTGGAGGTGPLTARTTSEVLGSRPVPLPRDALTPFRPDAECRRQPPPDLTARTEAKLVRTQHSPQPSLRMTAAKLSRLLRRVAARGRRR